MSLSRTFSPVLHFEDGNGHPLAGGYLCTYIAGTNTPVATFRDGNGTLNPTQIQLDSRGECEVWLDAAIRYKFALYDSTKTTPIWVKDDITAPGVVVMPDTKEVLAVGTSPVLVSAVTNNGITTFTVALDSTFTTAVSDNTTNIANEITRAQGAEGELSTRITNEVTRATGKEGELETAIGNEVTRAQAAEAAAKSVVVAGDNIEVNESTAQDGHKVYTVNGVESVPHVEIISPLHTLSVTSSENQQTNTKTFNIDVQGKELSMAWFKSALIYDTSIQRFISTRLEPVQNGLTNPQGDKFVYNYTNMNLSLKRGSYHFDVTYEVEWTGTPQNKEIVIAGNEFDLSYNHDARYTESFVRQLSASWTNLVLTLSISEAPPEGLTVKISKCEIYSIQGVYDAVVCTVDDELSSTSDNPVRNRVLYGVIGNVETLLAAL